MLYLEYNGKKYDVGTKVKTKGGDILMVERGGVTGIQLRNHNYSIPIRACTANIIVEIVEPVEVRTPLVYSSGRTPPVVTDIGWIWYIVIMVGGAFFYERLLVWTFATIYFVLWLKGFFNGGKK